jgi:myo-inositol 2-dehydrogenase/D-chiro-inositol 1-dehydrogenase
MSLKLNRREFVGLGAAVAAGSLLMSCAKSEAVKKWTPSLPSMLETAPDGPELKAGLIGCGGRGSGAVIDFLSAGNNLKVTALGDVFRDRLDSAREGLMKQKNNEVADEMCFTGFNAYQKVIDSGVDIVIIATPPYFRPAYFQAAVNAKKHVFMEKPVAVDPVGARSIMATSKKAEGLGLTVITGTQRRHEKKYIETIKQVANGAIGDIVSANCYWNGGQLWYREHEKGWSEMEYMIRDWVNWCWLSGDHIVQQHVHNLDVINWFTDAHPVKAVGMGSRQRRVTGDQFDNFSIDFVYENGMHLHSMCRQISGCVDNVSEWIVGTKGVTNCAGEIKDHAGKVIWKHALTKDSEGKEIHDKNPYVQEHIDLVTAIRTNKPRVEAENTAIATMTAIMGRISAYTGKEVTWEEMMSSDFALGPKELKLGPVGIKAVIPVPGTA